MNKCWKFVFILVFIFTSLANGQESDDPFEPEIYPFINYHLNYFHIFDSASFHPVFDTYQSIIQKGTGELSVVHIGGSHIQADIYTNRVRQRMAMFANNNRGTRGYIFPYKVAKTNNPWNYMVSYTGQWESCRNVKPQPGCRLGLSGAAVWTHDTSASMTISLRKYHHLVYDFNEVEFFHGPVDSSFSIKVAYPEDVQEITTDTAHNVTRFTFNKYHDELAFKLEKKNDGQTRFKLHGIRFMNQGPGVVYNAIGINGAAIHSFLGCELFGQHLALINPGWVIISLGTNDAYKKHFDTALYQDRYQALIDTVKKYTPGAAILLTVPNDSYYKRLYPNENTALVEDIIFNLARENGCAVWNLYEIMGRFNSSDIWYDLGLMKPDHVHFTVAGYLLKGDLFFNAFLENFEHYIDNQ